MTPETIKREKRGGRKKGTPNKRTLEVLELLDGMDCNPIEGMARIALGELECSYCDEDDTVTLPQFHTFMRMPLSDELKALPIEELNAMRTKCPKCGGSGYIGVEPSLAGKMFSELAQYIAPKRKAIEVVDGTNAHEEFLAVRDKINQKRQEEDVK